jgi:hypothetical protein
MSDAVRIAKREDTSPQEGEHKYGDVSYADEKNKKYPLDTHEHAKAALSYWGMPKNREKYSAEDQKTIGAKIHAAAKKFGIKTADDSGRSLLLRKPEVHLRGFKPTLSDDKLPAGIIGRVGGVAMVYNTVDDRGTEFAPGSLRASLDDVQRGKVKLFWDHGDMVALGFYDTDLHIGTVRSLKDITLPDGRQACYMTADIFDTEKGREVHEYLRSVAASGGETGLSIGMRDAKAEPAMLSNGRRGPRFNEVGLREITITAESSVPDTGVDMVRTLTLDGSGPIHDPQGMEGTPEDDPAEPDEDDLPVAMGALPKGIRSRRLLSSMLEMFHPDDVHDCTRDYWAGAGNGSTRSAGGPEHGPPVRSQESRAAVGSKPATTAERLAALRSSYT